MIELPLQAIIDKYNDLNERMLKVSNRKEMIDLSKKHKLVQPQYDIATKIKSIENEIAENKELLDSIDPSDEMVELLKNDISEKTKELKSYQSDILSYLTPVDERDSEDILLEIRAGAGGDESSLFVGQMLRMYINFAENKGFKTKIVSSNSGTVGGYKEVIVEVRGNGPYSWFKYESGVHRVQRIPETEKQGRVHTSTVSVAIMPIVETDDDFTLDMDEVEIIISTSTGAGGQSVNTTYSAVMMRHKLTGLEAKSQDERDQQQNRIKALQVLTSRVYDYYEQERLAKESQERRDQVGRADRSEKIRTYNFPQDRFTDHRYGKSWNQLPNILSGEIGLVIDQIRKMEAEKTLKNYE